MQCPVCCTDSGKHQSTGRSPNTPRDRWRCSPPNRSLHVEECGLRCASATVDKIQDQSQYTLASWSVCRCGNKTPALYWPDIYNERSNTAARVCGQRSYIVKTNCVVATTWEYLTSTSDCYSGCTFELSERHRKVPAYRSNRYCNKRSIFMPRQNALHEVTGHTARRVPSRTMRICTCTHWIYLYFRLLEQRQGQ